MRKIINLVLALALTLAIGTTAALAQEAPAQESALKWMFDLYDYYLPEDTLAAAHAAFAPQTFECGDVTVTLDEVLYDGVWLFTSGTATHKSPETTLIMPGSAFAMEDMVAGGYNEGFRNDTRTFAEAAKQDGKTLLAVYVYPLEFDTQCDMYFVDHRQDAGERSTLFAGGDMKWLDGEAEFTLSVQLYTVDLDTEGYQEQGSYEFPIKVKRAGGLQMKEYAVIAADATELPVTAITMIKTPLATYPVPTWRSEEVRYSCMFDLFSESGAQLPGSLSPDTTACWLDELPDALTANFFLFDEQETQCPAQLKAVTE